VKRNAGVARVNQTDAGAERITKLEEKLALAPIGSKRARIEKRSIVSKPVRPTTLDPSRLPT
jgi:hypothetical protein